MSWILITGAAQGLGRELSLRLAQEGYNILIHYNTSLHEAEDLAKLCQKKGVAADIFQADLLQSPINIPDKEFYGLINNMGLFLAKPLLSTSEEELQNLFTSHLYMPFFLIKRLFLSLKKHKGRIINIGTSGLYGNRANSYCPAYEISKSALWHLTRSCAKEMAADEITVNMISPGILPNSVDRGVKEHLIPAKQLCSFDNVTDVAAFLLKKSSFYITGQNIEVAGGFGL